MAIRLCALEDIAKGSALRVEIGAYAEFAVVRTEDDEVYVLDDVCSHADFPLTDGEICGRTIECALHGSRFDLQTGEPSGPPATKPVPTYAVTITDGEIYADIDEAALG